ncbi:hypothetical protein CHS0354_032160 [Potamilus streckersoni]|uniref:Sorting nexin-19 n=1 Tax=Potamilus streckersoni TaxID=2493646 RepID=A0AAE0TGS6_9BIVA|nr:hypothetical protein CHS0354_032160 [Potamilus streckersoni]
MNKIAVSTYDFVKDFASHHRKITAFQKIVAVSLIVGVSAVIHRNVFFLLICLTYLLSLACAIFITNHIIYTNVHVRSDTVLIFTVYFSSGLKSAFSIIRSICIEFFYGNGSSPQYKNEDQVPRNGNQNYHSLHELSEELPGLQLEHKQDSTFDNLPQDPEVMNNKSTFYLSCTEDEQESKSFYLQTQDSVMTQDESKTRVIDYAVNQKSLTTDTHQHFEMENSMLQVDNSASFINSALEATGPNSESLSLCRNRDIEEECTPELGKTIDHTVNNLLELIHRDFVNAWYQMISSNTEAPDELYAAFESIAEQFKIRLSQIDYHSLAGEICCLFQKHIQVVSASSRMLRTQSKRRHSLGRSKSNSTFPELQNSKIPLFYSLEDIYDSKWSLHPALKNDVAEMKYIQSVTGILIDHCVPANLHCSQTVQILFNEIITSNIFLNVLHHLCEPVFIFEKIIQISSDEEIFLGDESSIMSDNEREATNTEKVQSQNNVENHITLDRDSYSGDEYAGNVSCKWNGETPPEFLLDTLEATKTICTNSDVRLLEMEKNIARISSKNVERIEDVSLPEQIYWKEQVHGSSNHGSKFDLALVTETAKISVDCSNMEFCDHSSALMTLSSSSSTSYFPSGTVSSTKDTEEIFVTKETPLTLLHPSIKIFTKSEKEWSDKTSGLSQSPSTKYLDTDSLDEKYPSSPVDQADDVFETYLFDCKKKNMEAFDQKTARSSSLSVRLTDLGKTTLDVSLHKTFHSALIAATDTRKERGTSSSYTLYKVEYDALYPDETGELVPRKGTVWRRFREFINLQVRLEYNSEYKKSLKGIKGPKRWQLPFGNMDKDTVETRKKVLETYLKCLIDKPDICNGPELKEFLGYEGDGRIAFVRRPSDVGVRRIDQMLVRTVSGVFDKLVERLPSLPQELPSFSGKKEESKDDDSIPSDDVDCIEIDFSISERQTQSDCLLMENILERYTQLKGQKKPMATSQDGEITPEKSCISADTKEEDTFPKETEKSEAEMPLATHVLDILVEILSNHDNWVCRERVQTAARLVLGKALNRWLEEKVDFLISSEMVLFYLTTLEKTFWPEGEFLLEPRLQLTPQQEERIK